MQKKYLMLCAVLSLFLCLFSSVALAATEQSAKPLRLARVPLVIRAYSADAEVENIIENRLDLALHVPLNDTMHYVEEIPSSEVESALNDVLADLKTQHRRVKMKDAMQPLAEKLGADLVVCPVLTTYYEHIYYGGGWGWDSFDDMMILDSGATVELDGYDRSTQENFSQSASRYFHEGYAPSGRASMLAKDALETLVSATEINKRVKRPVRVAAGSLSEGAVSEAD